jgi:hypothetical protein
VQRSVTWAQSNWGWLAATGVGLLAAGLTVAHGLPYGHDSTLHLYRAVAWDFLVRHSLDVRWCPFLSDGYGSPLFDFYPPAFYALSQLMLLTGLAPLVALRVVLGLALIAGTLGMYTWAGDLFGRGSGVAAAAAFTFSPYLMCTLLNRASFPEVLNLAWMPWGAWALQRYERYAGGRSLAYAVLTAVVVAATLLTHLFSAYLFIAVMLIYALGLGSLAEESAAGAGNHPARGIAARLVRLAWPLGLGLGLSAWFWLPALAEVGWVQIERMLLIADPATGQGLIPAWQVFAGPVLPDQRIPVAAVSPRLSSLAAGLALVGVVAGWVALRSRRLKMHLGAGVLVVGLAVFMHTPASRWLWQAVPLLRLGQFPFRFLSAGSLWLALLAGAGSAALLAAVPSGERLRSRLIPAGLALGLCLLLALYSLGGPPIAVHAPDTPTDLAAVLRFEQDPTPLGLQTGGEYRVRTVQELPPLGSGPGMGGPRLDVASLPAGAQVLQAEYAWLRYRLTLDSPQPFQAVFRTFAFPGWGATVDGYPVPITPIPPYGLISLPVPAGRQQVEVFFGSTPVRTLAAGLSLVSALGLAALLFRIISRRWAHERNTV